MVFERFWSKIGYVCHSIWLGIGQFVYDEISFFHINFGNFLARAAHPNRYFCVVPPNDGGGVRGYVGL